MIFGVKVLESKIQRHDSGYDATRILIDYFCFTISFTQLYDYDDPSDATIVSRRMMRKLFFPSFLPWQERRGMYGYTSALWYDGIVLAWGGSDTVYVQMSGTGCRTWETLHPGLTWERWLQYLHDTYSSLHISRMDVACDTFKRLKLSTIINYTRKGWYISRWKTYLINDGNREHSVVWGSPKSDFRLRIYDKSAERSLKTGLDPAEVPQGWVRCEFQLRNDSVKSFIRAWKEQESVGLAFWGIMRNQLLYCTDYKGQRCSRAHVARWWQKMLEDAERIKMSYEGGKTYNLDTMRKYISHQVSPTLKAVLAADGWTLDWLLRQVDAARLNPKQLEAVSVYTNNIEDVLQEQCRWNDYLDLIGDNFPAASSVD